SPAVLNSPVQGRSSISRCVRYGYLMFHYRYGLHTPGALCGRVRNLIAHVQLSAWLAKVTHVYEKALFGLFVDNEPVPFGWVEIANHTGQRRVRVFRGSSGNVNNDILNRYFVCIPRVGWSLGKIPVFIHVSHHFL